MKVIKIFLINFFILFFLLWIFELTINIKKEKLFFKNRLYYLNKDKSSKENIYLNFGSYKLLDKNLKILPLSGYDNSNILLCLNENNQPNYYKSDINGFRNANKNMNINFLLVGDSYVQGMCVDDLNNLNAQFLKHNFKTASLGIGGNGPLLEYATFKEFHEYYKYENIILFITPDNDYYDLSLESKNKILIQYLDEDNFIQNLSSNKNKILKKKILDNYFGNTNILFNDFFNTYHLNLKELKNLIKRFFNNNYLLLNTYNYLNDTDLDNLFFKIINKFQNSAINKKINFYIVFNLVEPKILYPNSKQEKIYSKIILDKIELMKNYFNKNNVRYYDFNEFVKQNYNIDTINNIFKIIDNRWDHYTNLGYNLIVANLLDHFKLKNN